MECPQDAVSVLHFIVKIRFGQVQIQRNGPQQHPASVFQRPVGGQGGIAELRVFGGQHVGGHVANGFGLANVVKLFKIGNFKAFGRFFAFADVAPLPIQFGMLVLLFDGIGGGEKRLCRIIKLLGEVVGETVVAEGYKTNLVESPAQILHEPGFLVGVARREIG